MKSNTADSFSYYRHLLTETALPGQEAAWLASLRQREFDRFLQNGFPSRKQEDWKYTSTAALANTAFEINLQTQPLDKNRYEKTNPFIRLEYHTMVFVNGIFNKTLSHLDNLPKGVVLKEIIQAILSNEISSEAQFENNAHRGKPSCHGFSTLNIALMQSGFYLAVPENCTIEKPIHVMYIACDTPYEAHLHNHIVMEKGSHAHLIEHYIGLDKMSYFNNVISDIFLKEEALLNHCKITAESEDAFHIATTRTTQGRSSTFKSYSFASGGKLIRSDTHTLLKEKESEALLQGVFIAKNQQHIDHHTYIEHASEHTRSREWYKGIAHDKGRGVFNGRVRVEKGAIGTSAEQRSNNLLLSREAEIDTKPELEIFNDDVRCAHGATVGYLDEEALFYCATRGIPLKEARFLLTFAFVKEVVDTLENPHLRSILMYIMQSVLEDQIQC
ncbi:MAG: sufD [Gammaproteobacteria bacterium]|jgi:Fe-S cluster assembly protein SufD|nr:sufD [Gammaproteobacteria bacterium]